LESFLQISLLSHLRRKKRAFLTFLAAQQSLKDRSSKDSKVRKRKMRSVLDFLVFLQIFKTLQLFKPDLIAACVRLWQCNVAAWVPVR